MVEGARLESVYTPKAYRGFESLPLRQNAYLSKIIATFHPQQPILRLAADLGHPLSPSQLLGTTYLKDIEKSIDAV